MAFTGDHIIRTTAYDGLVRCSAVTGVELCRQAAQSHGLSPIVAVALGRLLMGALLLSQDLKNDDDQLTITVSGSGPIGGMTVVAKPQGRVKGLVQNPVVESTYHRPNKLNVGEAVGSGFLTVVRSTSIGDPYVGRIELVSGEIAEDLVAYCFYSEQLPSLMSLGVRVNQQGVEVAGGLLIQALPGATEEIISHLESKIQAFGEITPHLSAGLAPLDILREFFGESLSQNFDEAPVAYHCDCSHQGMEKALLTLGENELRELAADKEGITLECHFCPATYHFDQAAIEQLLERTTERS